MAPRKSVSTKGTDPLPPMPLWIRKTDGEDKFYRTMVPRKKPFSAKDTDAKATSHIRKAVAGKTVADDTFSPRFAPRKSISTKDTGVKATSHIRKSVAGKPVAEDTVEQIIEFASTILEQPTKAEMTVLNDQTENNLQFNEVLDSIARISLSPAKGEVVSVALQVGKTDIRLIVASNNTLPDSTITHQKEIWNLLKQLREDLDAASRISISPRNEDLSQDAKTRMIHYKRKILRFNHQRMRRDVTKYYSAAISLHKHQVQMFGLEDIVTQLKALKRALNQPAPADETWDYIWTVLRRINCQFQMESEKIRYFQDISEVPFNLHRYLYKIISITQDAKYLFIQANSPPLRELLRRDFQIINVKASGGIPSNSLNSGAEWTQLVHNILEFRNMAADEKGLVRFVLDKTEVQQDTAEMCKTPHRKSNFLHCELELISYILQRSEQGFLGYIGLSKLSCEGCVHFMRAVESVLGVQFKVKNAARTFDYPWAFPDIPHAPSVAEQMRKSVSLQIGRTYDGFNRENKRYHSDSNVAP